MQQAIHSQPFGQSMEKAEGPWGGAVGLRAALVEPLAAWPWGRHMCTPWVGLGQASCRPYAAAAVGTYMLR